MIDIAAPRSVAEWIGVSPDTPVPPRVKARVFLRAKGRCQLCGRNLASGDKWDADHRKALINGGQNRECNLQIACDWCHPEKTKRDLAEKSKTARIRANHIGIKRAKSLIPGSRATRWKRKINGTVELR